MLHAKMDGSRAYIDPAGMPITETAEPEAVGVFRSTYRIERSGDALAQVWELVPIAGTAQEAALTVARIMAESFTDELALRVPALYPEWAVGTEYKSGDRRLYLGYLYKYIGAEPTVSTAQWNPRDAHSLWVQLKPQDEGEVAEWEQRLPGVTDGYADGELVTYGGKTYRSTKDGNYDVPGKPNTAWELVS